MSKRLRTELSEITPEKVYGDNEKVLECLISAIDDIILCYPTNTIPDPQTVLHLEHFFTWCENEKGELVKVKSEPPSDELVTVMKDFCDFVEDERYTDTPKGSNAEVFSYVDFFYNVRKVNNDEKLAKLYEKANLAVEYVDKDKQSFASYVYCKLQQFISYQTIRDPLNLRKYILAITAAPRLDMCLTKNFVAFGLLEYYFAANRYYLRQMISARADKHYKALNHKDDEAPRSWDYFPPNNGGWETLMKL